jgi:hypothetical protein
MNRTISTACAQAFRSASFWIGAAGTALALLTALFSPLYEAFTQPDLLPWGSHVQLFQEGVSSDVMTLTLPIFAALPCTAAYLEDVTSGFVKHCLTRTGRREYIAGRLVSCLLSGGCALALGALAAFGVLSLLLLPREAALQAEETAAPWLSGLLQSCLLLFCSGALWAAAGLAMSAVTGSKYMAYAAPFVLYYVLIILRERYFTTLVVWDPREWVVLNQTWPGGMLGIVLLTGEQTALWSAVFGLLAERRLRQL